MFVPVLAILFLILVLTYFYYQRKFQYWKKRKVPFLPPSIPFGNRENPWTRKEHSGFYLKKVYDHLKANGYKHAGIYTFTRPNYLVINLDYLKNIMTKDFDYFTDRAVISNDDEPLNGHLFNLGGQKWRNMRVKLSPTFTSGKMKMMFSTLLECVDGLLENIEKNPKEIDIKEVLGCFTTDIIGSCAFGLECNSFKDEDSPFRSYGKKFFTFSRTDIVKFLFSLNFPKIARYLKIRLVSKDITDFFVETVQKTISYREQNNVFRKDFLQLLMDLKDKDDGLSFEQIAAQSFVFFIAGFETSSTTSAFALYELARNLEIQEKLRKEVLEVLAKHDNQITYEAIQDLKYMDQVINETLRKYPPLPILTRECVRDYKLPDDDVVLEKGTMVLIPVLGIHYDKEYYPDPETFDPERFSEINKTSRHSYAHIPFGEGPRICIGMRFGLMQTKIGLAVLLRKFKFSINQKTVEPLKIKPFGLILAAQGEIWLDAENL